MEFVVIYSLLCLTTFLLFLKIIIRGHSKERKLAFKSWIFQDILALAPYLLSDLDCRWVSSDGPSENFKW
jgi:hypothetical protein